MNVFGYIRVSGKSQVDGDGPERQQLAIEAFCKAHNLRLLGFFSDLAVSGATDYSNREQFAAMLAAVIAASDDPAQCLHGIVVERMDRLARDLMVSELAVRELRKQKLALYAADQGALVDQANTDIDPTRKLIRQIFGALAEWDKTNIVRRLRAARERARGRFGRCEGSKPFGYYTNEQPAAAFIRAAVAANRGNGRSGSIAFSLVAELANAAGFVNRAGKPFTRKSIFKLAISNKPFDPLDSETDFGTAAIINTRRGRPAEYSRHKA